MKGIKIEVPDFTITHNHHINLPPIQWEPLLIIAALVALVLFRRSKD